MQKKEKREKKNNIIRTKERKNTNKKHLQKMQGYAIYVLSKAKGYQQELTG